jgi:hypothetical protein
VSLACRVGKSGCYATLAEALKELARIQQVSTRDVQPQRAYPCNFCRAWHLTSQPRRNPLRRKRR